MVSLNVTLFRRFQILSHEFRVPLAVQRRGRDGLGHYAKSGEGSQESGPNDEMAIFRIAGDGQALRTSGRSRSRSESEGEVGPVACG